MIAIVLMLIILIVGAIALTKGPRASATPNRIIGSTPLSEREPWYDDPMTNKQRNILRLFDVYNGELKKGQASEVITVIFKDETNRHAWGAYCKIADTDGDTPVLLPFNRVEWQNETERRLDR